jgi:hypothetical protein
MDFGAWSENWRALRSEVGNTLGVIKQWNLHPPAECLKPGWNIPEGCRKETYDGGTRGEQKIEAWFLGEKGGRKIHKLVKPNGKDHYPITAVFQNMGLATRKKGNRIVDCLGILRTKHRHHPLAVEVKVTADNLWYAVVENLQQVRMLRCNVANVQDHFRDKRCVDNFRGAWGLVLAPRTYFKKQKQENRGHVEELLDAMHGKTEARIILGIHDIEDIENVDIEYFDGYWPTESPP